MISDAELFVTALLIRTSLYGLYIVTFGICLRWLIVADEGWRLRKTYDWTMITVAILIFVSTTIWLGAFARLTMLLVKGVDVDNYTVYALGAVTIAGTSMIILATDAVMIYRCWKVCRRSWRITVFPMLCWLGYLISSALVFYYNHQSLVAPTEAKAAWADNQSLRLNIVLYPFNAAISIYTTTAIIYRVMRDAKMGSGHSLKRLQKLCRILAETGFLYTLTTIPPLVAYLLNSKYSALVFFVTDGVNYSMAGIAFNLILIRIGQSRAEAVARSPESQASDGRKLLSGQNQRYPFPSTQEQTINLVDIEQGTLHRNVLSV